MTEFFKVTEEQPGGAAFVAPLSATNNGKYLIEFDSKAQAEVAMAKLLTGELPTPLEDASRYAPPRIHPNGKTKVYRLRAVVAPNVHHRDDAGESISDEDRDAFMDDVYGKGRH